MVLGRIDMKYDRIEITKSLIPYSFNILLGANVYNFAISYNKNNDFFTVRLSKDDEVICEGEPLVYGMPLFEDIYVAGKFPAFTILPLDESNEQTAVTWDNFGETVFLSIDNVGGDDDE